MLFLGTFSMAHDEGTIPDIVLDCGQGIQGVTLREGTTGIMSGNAYYNYSSVRLNCAYTAKYRLEEGDSFICAGVWENEGDLALARFSKCDQGWKASFVTTKIYGSKEVTLRCQER